jgi:hypothetical protein
MGRLLGAAESLLPPLLRANAVAAGIDAAGWQQHDNANQSVPSHDETTLEVFPIARQSLRGQQHDLVETEPFFQRLGLL